MKLPWRIGEEYGFIEVPLGTVLPYVHNDQGTWVIDSATHGEIQGLLVLVGFKMDETCPEFPTDVVMFGNGGPLDNKTMTARIWELATELRKREITGQEPAKLVVEPLGRLRATRKEATNG